MLLTQSNRSSVEIEEGYLPLKSKGPGTEQKEEYMDFLGLLKDIISIVVIANAATGHKDESMTEEYAGVLETILKSGNDNH